MRRLLSVALLVLVVVVAFALLGDSLPEGTALRSASDALRSVGEGIARSFGGGYGELATP